MWQKKIKKLSAFATKRILLQPRGKQEMKWKK